MLILILISLFHLSIINQPVEELSLTPYTVHYLPQTLYFLIARDDILDFNNIPRTNNGIVFAKKDLLQRPAIELMDIIGVLEKMEDIHWKYYDGRFIITTTENIHNYLAGPIEWERKRKQTKN